MALVVPDWLNVEFMERALKHGENDNSIKVEDMTIKPATNKGDNYTSEMHRCTVEFTRDRKGKRVTEKRPIIVKVAPTTEGAHKDMIVQAGIFTVEITMMTTALKEMQALLPETKISGKCLYAENADPSRLVIEDLAPLGYRMACREAGLDLAHCSLALKGLAKFHAASVATYEKNPQYKTMFNKGMFNNINPPELTKFFVDGMAHLARVVRNWPELGKTYGDKISKLASTMYKRTADCRLPNEADFNVINHGDFWVNNMLFRYDDDGKVINHIFVDFQLSVYGSPGIDLNYFLNTSPSDDVFINHHHDILEEYLNVLTATMLRLGCKTEPPSMTQLREAMRKTELVGLMAACVILPIVRADKAEAQTLEEMLSTDGEFRNKGCEAAAFKKAICPRLQKWEAMGLLD